MSNARSKEISTERQILYSIDVFTIDNNSKFVNVSKKPIKSFTEDLENMFLFYTSVS